jgi:uncharacterized protein involved in oxidation of intracellular sulfur
MDDRTQSILFVLNEGAYGNERSYNALRLAMNLVKRPEIQVRIFMTGDGVLCARRGQKNAEGLLRAHDQIPGPVRPGGCVRVLQ